MTEVDNVSANHLGDTVVEVILGSNLMSVPLAFADLSIYSLH